MHVNGRSGFPPVFGFSRGVEMAKIQLSQWKNTTLLYIIIHISTKSNNTNYKKVH